LTRGNIRGEAKDRVPLLKAIPVFTASKAIACCSELVVVMLQPAGYTVVGQLEHKGMIIFRVQQGYG
jgi:hypothetical protein